jgi:hypothetical protein
MPVLSVCQSQPALLTRARTAAFGPLPHLAPGPATPARPHDHPGHPPATPEPGCA